MIVLPMAGLSRRFIEAGYEKPKYALPLAGRPVFDWALLSFAGSFGQEPILIVYRDVPGLAQFLEERILACKAPNVTLAALPSATSGQAETVAKGIEIVGVAASDALSIFNIDTFRPGLRIPPQSASQGYIEVFEGEGTHWSFVEPASTGSDLVRRVVEKQRISNLCCTGFYHFATAELFDRAYRAEIAQPSSYELFVAPLYQHLIDEGAQIRYGVIDRSDVYFCGTPDEYESLRLCEETVHEAFAPLSGSSRSA